MNILILCPMERECKNMLDALSSAKFPLKNSYKVVCCGVGKANAACTAALEVGTNPSIYDFVAVVGYAAGSTKFHQGDIVIPNGARYHDCDVPEGLVPELTSLYELAGVDEVTVLTGDSFITTDSANDLTKKYGSNVIFDMEIAAVAQVISEYNIPLVVVKMISDVPQIGDNAQSFDEFVNTHPDFSAFVNYLDSLAC